MTLDSINERRIGIVTLSVEESNGSNTSLFGTLSARGCEDLVGGGATLSLGGRCED